MDNYPRSPRKLQKRSTSTSPLPRHSLENVSISESALSFGETRTLSGDTEHDEADKGRISSVSQRHLLEASTDAELGGQERSHRSPLWWATEIVVLFGGLLCLIAIVIILWRADGRPPPQWPLNTNLNTIIAFLASLAKVTFVMAIVEGLGQLKWIWFLSSKPRPLIDFQIFEEATKGGWGSWKLLFRFKGFLASFGALILVSGLLTSTFTQMAITYPVIQAEAKNGTEVATIERATGFSVYNGNELIPGPFEAVREQQAVYQGGFYPPNEDAPHVAPVCSSGDCVWPTYGSLAVCSDVVNLTAQGNPALLENLRNVTSKAPPDPVHVYQKQRGHLRMDQLPGAGPTGVLPRHPGTHVQSQQLRERVGQEAHPQRQLHRLPRQDAQQLRAAGHGRLPFLGTDLLVVHQELLVARQSRRAHHGRSSHPLGDKTLVAGVRQHTHPQHGLESRLLPLLHSRHLQRYLRRRGRGTRTPPPHLADGELHRKRLDGPDRLRPPGSHDVGLGAHGPEPRGRDVQRRRDSQGVRAFRAGRLLGAYAGAGSAAR
ncbi:hypothetical protein CONLIGDRAFT_626323 [Coniochaeta ligniaria NRRL 30616]|uniref:Uncharacterized protein n=1 Tax=Coniochaeta ligniaria NRRL 30616 TaxID=1408157 RepID=A0A1J7J493_9PEZI|nr:hypothetical protein CONLIGDRAFT_626323 [Coniochaeta ligniaria NRRL 30616]